MPTFNDIKRLSCPKQQLRGLSPSNRHFSASKNKKGNSFSGLNGDKISPVVFAAVHGWGAWLARPQLLRRRIQPWLSGSSPHHPDGCFMSETLLCSRSERLTDGGKRQAFKSKPHPGRGSSRCYHGGGGDQEKWTDAAGWICHRGWCSSPPRIKMERRGSLFCLGWIVAVPTRSGSSVWE